MEFFFSSSDSLSAYTANSLYHEEHLHGPVKGKRVNLKLTTLIHHVSFMKLSHFLR